MKRVIQQICICVLLAAICSAFERNVTFESSTKGIQIAGSLTVPQGILAKFAVVLVSVAGPDDRNLSLGERGIYREVASVLAAQGIASLRIADRGVDGSTGDWKQTTLEDRTHDVQSAMNFLLAQPEVANAKGGIIGISEGAGIALMLARSPIQFVVALSTPVSYGADLMRWQREKLLAMSPAPEELKSKVRSSSDALLKAIQDGNAAAAEAVLSSDVGPYLLPGYKFVPTELKERVKFVMSPWYTSQVNYDIRPIFSKVQVPVFAVYGSLDVVLDPVQSAKILSETVPKEFLQLELRKGFNHLMMPAKTGFPNEYQTLPDLISREFWNDIAAWILRQ